MHTKNFDAKVKAAGPDGGLKEGQVRAVVSVFGNEDSVGDVVMPGAFKEDLDQWQESGDKIPFIWAHDWADPFSHLGEVIEANETDVGLEVLAEIHDLDVNPKAAQVYRLLKGRRVTQFSFAYDIQDAGWGEKDGREVFELRKLQILEAGPCLVGANQETELLAVKAREMAAGVKAGRVLSQKNYDRLTEARDAISAVIDSAVPDEEKTSPPPGGDASQEKASTVPDEDPNDLDKSEDEMPAKSLAAPVNQLQVLALAGAEGDSK